ncbi:MAG: 4-hydroxybutyrate dehydrogenase [Christensenellaceae bacterium]|jgi:4-hydroxybutyrate dehydrogenase
MKLLQVAPVIYGYDTFKAFADEFKLGPDDLILTNEYIYEPFMAKYNLGCKLVFQEKFGMGEPDDKMVQGVLDEVKKLGAKRIVAVGGGTIIDIAKILVLEGEDDLYKMYDNVDKLKKGRELIVVPTTCGTGSEVTNITIVNLTKLGTKKGLVSELMYADSAVLIPEFLSSLPYGVFATSSIDALIHAVEAYLNLPKGTPFTDMFAVDAIKAILEGYKLIAQKGQDARFEYSDQFLRASTAAGIAFGNSSCAAVHAMSYALGANYHVPHGESNYQFFTSVLNMYKKKAPGGKLAQLEELINSILGSQDAIPALSDLLEKILPKKKMSDYGVKPEEVATFAKSTVDNQQRLLSGNYVPFTLEDIQAIYQERL